MSIYGVVREQTYNFKGKHFLTLADYSKEEIEHFIDLGLQLKKKQKQGIHYQPLKGKTLGMIFEKSSTRTRVAFEVGMVQLGGYPLFLSKSDLQLGRGETIADTARVLSRYLDGIMMRTDDQGKLIELAQNSSIPIINGLSDIYHPSQAIADFMTIYEYKKKWTGMKIAYVGDGNNVANSLMITAAKLGIDLTVATPKGYEPMNSVIEFVKEEAKKQGSLLTITDDPHEAVKNADVIYTDVWTSMGQEEEAAIRMKKFADYQVNDKLIQSAKDDYIFMHCLPAHREEEVTDAIIEGKHSVVFDEAENRLHAHKAILSTFL